MSSGHFAVDSHPVPFPRTPVTLLFAYLRLLWGAVVSLAVCKNGCSVTVELIYSEDEDVNVSSPIDSCAALSSHFILSGFPQYEDALCSGYFSACCDRILMGKGLF